MNRAPQSKPLIQFRQAKLDERTRAFETHRIHIGRLYQVVDTILIKYIRRGVVSVNAIGHLESTSVSVALEEEEDWRNELHCHIAVCKEVRNLLHGLFQTFVSATFQELARLCSEYLNKTASIIDVLQKMLL